MWLVLWMRGAGSSRRGPAQLGPPGHPRPGALLGGEPAFGNQFGVGLGHGVSADAEIGGERTEPGSRVSGTRRPVRRASVSPPAARVGSVPDAGRYRTQKAGQPQNWSGNLSWKWTILPYHLVRNVAGMTPNGAQESTARRHAARTAHPRRGPPRCTSQRSTPRQSTTPRSIASCPGPTGTPNGREPGAPHHGGHGRHDR